MKHDNDNRRPISFISMFSGIEAASVAFGPLGWKPICFAEIEKFPSAVLAHHYPDVPNVGDMSKHDWAQYDGKVDIVCGGPPCQDFSIAGLRAGLDGARGNLSITYMRALHAIKPRNAIVENVPGWLNDKKNAFGCFLQDLSAQMIPCERQTGSLGQTQVWLPGHSDGPRGVYSTLNILPWPNDAVVLSLSQILETGPIPQRFFLSAKACSGILRRAEKRGKTLPEQLRVALEAVAFPK